MSLGKGLYSLIPPHQPQGDEVGVHETGPESVGHRDVSAHPQTDAPHKQAHVYYVEVEKITPNPQQPRREFNEEELQSLADSIRRYGVLQPLTVTKKEIDLPHGRKVEYELLAGERRLRASKLAGFSQVPVIIKEADSREKLELALIENVQREDLNPIEEAEAYKKLTDDFQLTQEEVSSRVGKSREVVANKLRLLTLPRDVQLYIADSLLSEGHGKVLLSVENPERVRMYAKEAIRSGWSVRALEENIQKSMRPHQSEERMVDPQLERYKKLVEEELGTAVTFSGSHEKGKLQITFNSQEDLERLIARLAKVENSVPPPSEEPPSENEPFVI